MLRGGCANAYLIELHYIWLCMSFSKGGMDLFKTLISFAMITTLDSAYGVGMEMVHESAQANIPRSELSIKLVMLEFIEKYSLSRPNKLGL